MIKQIILTATFSFLTLILLSQKERILLDGQFEDWENRNYSYTDPSGDGRFGYDFTEFIIENDEAYLYFYFDTGIEINLQEFNDIAIVLDTDNNYETGYPIDNLGAELIYYFGERGGSFFKGSSQYNIQQDDIGLISLPTISSERFEIGINLNSNINGNSLFTGSEIKCLLIQDVQNGDKVPDNSGGLSYTIIQEDMDKFPDYALQFNEEAAFRLLSYNVLRDRLFESKSSFERQIKAINPDIIAFQEIYDHSAAQTRVLVESWLGGEWYAAKQGADIITVSKYPIIKSYYVNGNGAFLLDINGKECLLINAHLPCCDNDSGRQDEVDAIMAFIRDSQNEENSLILEENTPIIICGDMNFVGKNRQLKTFLEGDIQNEFSYGEDFNPDWDGSSLKDMLAYATHTPFAITWHDNYSSYVPGRLDYIIYTDAVLKLQNGYNLFSSTLPVDSLTAYQILEGDTKNASDHIPVVADFSFEPSSFTTDPEKEAIIITASPNPFGAYMDIHIEGNPGTVFQLIVSNVAGKVLYQMDKLELKDDSKLFRIDSKRWKQGLYFLSLRSGNMSHALKLIKAGT